MKKHFLLFSSIYLFCFTTFAQTKLLTMEDAIVKQRTSLAPAKLKQLMWVKGTNNFSYIGTKNNEDVLIIGSAESIEKKEVLLVSQLNDAMVSNLQEPLKSFPTIQWKDENKFWFIQKTNLLVYDLRTRKLIQEESQSMFQDAEHTDVSTVSYNIAYTIKNNLYITSGKEKLQITKDENENIVNGQSVHRDEFGITKGTYWSPSGTALAFYRMDQTMVTDYPIIDWTQHPAKVNEIKYPMAGDKSHEVTIGVYSVTNKTTVFLKTGEPKEQYLTNITWTPDEQHIFLQVLNRAQNEMEIRSYNVITGEFERSYYSEKSDKYVHPMHPLVFVPAHNNQFILQTESMGYNQLGLISYNVTTENFNSMVAAKYNNATSFKLFQDDNRSANQSHWVVTDFAGVDATGENTFFTATVESGITRNFYKMNLKDGNLVRLTQGDGTHTVMLSDDKKYFIDNFQSTTVPREIAVYNTSGKKIQTLLTAENPMKEFKLGQLSLFTLKNNAGDSLYCRMYKPIDFSENKKYPVLVYVYNGPGVQLINNTWNGGGDMWLQYMAERGFVVFTMDGRGSANRGLAFEQASFRHLGKVEMEDQMMGVEYLKSLKYVDANRMALMGWSYGGFMTTSIMTTYPDVFKVAVAGGPVIDWSYYEIMYTERYMDTPKENPDGYKETSLLNKVDNLKGKLMLIHGAQDNVVVWQHSMMFLKAAVDKGKQVDYFVYPGHEHNVIGKDRVNLFDKISEYIIQNLK